jgi:hypothetical protein
MQLEFQPVWRAADVVEEIGKTLMTAAMNFKW